MPVAEKSLTLECLESLSPLQYPESCLMGRDGPRTPLSQRVPETMPTKRWDYWKKAILQLLYLCKK